MYLISLGSILGAMVTGGSDVFETSSGPASKSIAGRTPREKGFRPSLNYIRHVPALCPLRKKYSLAHAAGPGKVPVPGAQVLQA